MDLSTQLQNLSEKSQEGQASLLNSVTDILDLSKIELSDEETWLYEPHLNCDTPAKNLNKWLQEDSDCFKDDLVKVPRSKAQKILDTRTFTRPKKKLTRPSIEQFTEQMNNSGSDTNEMNSSTEGLKKSDDSGVFTNSFNLKNNDNSSSNYMQGPLHFDLAQPTSSFYFENVMLSSVDLDSFQNMSPPSLVNSMCSSTFANLMESSFIKNDPVLREIRDTDFTETVLLQDTEQPMFQSITESFSSINSDSPESFLKKISFNGTFKKNMSKEFMKSQDVDATFDVNTTFEEQSKYELSKPELSNMNKSTEELIDAKVNQSFKNLNGTYRRTPKVNGTFRKSDPRFATRTINATFEIPTEASTEKETSIATTENLNSTETLKSNRILENHTFEEMKKELSETKIIQTDINRLSYCVESENVNTTYTEQNNSDKCNTTYTAEENSGLNSIDKKRSSLGSADSLDRMSSISSSSKGSNRMLNMADIDAIVEMQERSLNQVMSTPLKPGKKLWENNFISPILNNLSSDSEISSNEEFKSVRSTTSSKKSLDAFVKPTAKSLGYIGGNLDARKLTQRTTYTLANQKPLQAIPGNIRASYGNLKTVGTKKNITGSQSNLYRPSNHIVKPQQSQSSNLKTLAPKLKGSYTSLRPINANLPVAPPVNSALNATKTLVKATNPNVTQIIDGHGSKVAEVPPMPREVAAVTSGDNTFIKPQIPRASGLPRPTGIPRPASRIPGPRSSNLRPVSSRTTKYDNYY